MLAILEAEMAPVRVRLLALEAPRSEPETILIVDDCMDAAPSVSLMVSREGELDTLKVDLAETRPEARARTVAVLGAEAIRSPPPEPAREVAPPPESDAPASAATSTSPARGNASRARPRRRQPGETTPDGDPLPARERSDFVTRGGATLRLVPEGSGVFAGATAGFEWSPLAAGVLVLGTDRASPTGHLRVFALAGTASLEGAVESEEMGLRLDTELGAAFASGPGLLPGTPPATLHVAVSGNLWGRLPISDELSLETSTGLGYASSVNATSRRRGNEAPATVGLDGWFANVGVAVRR
jgi:hypothetical protein